MNMNSSTAFLRRGHAGRCEQKLPDLPPCERAVALVVHEKMVVTASEICLELNGRISNGAVRTMLIRLMRKGVLRRYRSGYGKTFLYVPAAAHGDLSELAFRRLAEDFFDGSIPEAANAIANLLRNYAQSSEPA